MRKPTEIERLADMVSLYVDVASSGTGRYRRYRFFNVPRDFFAGGHIFEAKGRAQAITFLRGYAAGMVADNERERMVCQ